MYKALGGRDEQGKLKFPVHYAPSKKLVPVSLSRSGLPSFILRRHRIMMLRGREVEKWVRTYATLFQLYNMIVVPVEASVQSIIDPRDDEVTYLTGLGL